MAALALSVACTAGSGASPKPTLSPTTPPTASPTASATAAAHIDHPTDSHQVILRMEWGGGLVPMEFFVTQIPQFTLYGDGTAIFRPLPRDDGMGLNEPSDPFLTVRLDEAEIQALLDYALNDGHLALAKESYSDSTIMDAASTVFTINAGGYDRTVNVYALMESNNDGPDAADREQMFHLSTRLANFATEAQGFGDVTPYEPADYRVTLFEQSGATPQPKPIDWPWPDVRVSDFQPEEGRPGVVMYMNADLVGELTKVPNGGQARIWVKANNGTIVELAVRPLLPDEIGYTQPAMPASS